MASDFDQSLDALDSRLQEIQKASKAVVSAVGRARSAAKLGRASEITRLLDDIARRIGEANLAADGVSNAWQFDTSSYLTDGRFIADLRAAATATGLDLFERDGRIYCFPLLLRADPRANAVKIGTRLERRIRPVALARLLADMQNKSQRFREPQFLELLYRSWQRLAGNDRRAAPAVPLADIHDVLTLLPGADYPVEEFARDLLLLDRRPDLRTRDGCRFELPGSTLARSGHRIYAYDQDGTEHFYVAIRFVRDG